MFRDSSEIIPLGIPADGGQACRIRLRNEPFTVDLCNHGAAWMSFFVPSRDDFHRQGEPGFDVLLGPERYDPVLGAGGKPSFGVVVGRFANRIAGSKFLLDGKTYLLEANDGVNHLHGGSRGFGKRLWDFEVSSIRGDPAVRFHLHSPDGDAGYPGNLEVSATYILRRDGIAIVYEAQADANTPLNLTNHAYFNLGSGPVSRSGVAGHIARFRASQYLRTDTGKIPLPGPPANVRQTCMDFLEPHAIGERIADTGRGYDHCFLVDPPRNDEPYSENSLVTVASVRDPESDRYLEVDTDFPAFQFYTGNYLGGVRGKGGILYEPHDGFCIETQYCPDSPNRPDFPSALLESGRKWKKTALFRFGVHS